MRTIHAHTSDDKQNLQKTLLPSIYPFVQERQALKTIKTAISHTIEMLCIYLSTKIELTMYTSHKIIFELHFLFPCVVQE